jgi:hypothetical protein
VTTARQEGIQKLYHYQDGRLDYLKDTLANSRVHFSNPRNFNDPWDCRPCFDSDSLTDPLCRRKWGTFFEPNVALLNPESQAVLRALGANWFDNQVVLRRVLDGMTSGIEQRITELWRIYCLTAHADSLLMWSHYGDKHRGICLEFDAGREFGGAFRVVYRDELQIIGPDILAADKVLADTILLSKSSEWSREDEYRILARDAAGDPTFTWRTDGDYLALPAGALKAIAMGCNADVDAIRNVVKECAPGVPLKHAVRKPHRYHLDIVDDTARPV